jgi:hyperosmotically inducible protein
MLEPTGIQFALIEEGSVQVLTKRRLSMRQLAVLMVLGAALSGCDRPAGSATTAVDRDNTGVNERDRNDAAKTPLDQYENQTDVDITANIRKKVVDTEMSVNAQNVKIITQNGQVTLRGPVESIAEKQKIEEIAASVAGDGKIHSELEVEQQP